MRLLSIIKGYRLLRICSLLDKLANHEQGLRQHCVSPHEKTGIVQVLFRLAEEADSARRRF